ncbi:uncharacterized protein LOC124161288 [Ischnura elegans]|uniref:uncharacterized protein LOC124161288 n=1 Tax=Ischnura elegans TaxID=197161 RepID=UPI001ED8BB0E|nr:uncharacterized protein LOC124161288 [Ischnura elegans]
MTEKLILPLWIPSASFILILLAVTPLFSLTACEEQTKSKETPAHGITPPLVFPSIEDEEMGHLTPLSDIHDHTGHEDGVTGEEKTNKVSTPAAAEKVPDGFKVNVTWRVEGNSSGGEDSIPPERIPSNSTEAAGSTPPKDVSNTTTADGKYRPPGVDDHWLHDHPAPRAGPLRYGGTPEATALIAGLFVGVAIFGYLGLVCWRRALERRYGNRELLVDEEEVVETDDLRNYTL